MLLLKNARIKKSLNTKFEYLHPFYDAENNILCGGEKKMLRENNQKIRKISDHVKETNDGTKTQSPQRGEEEQSCCLQGIEKGLVL